MRLKGVDLCVTYLISKEKHLEKTSIRYGRLRIAIKDYNPKCGKNSTEGETMKPPYFYAYLAFFAVNLFMELVAIRRKNTEQALTMLVAMLLVFIGLMNARVWTM